MYYTSYRPPQKTGLKSYKTKIIRGLTNYKKRKFTNKKNRWAEKVDDGSLRRIAANPISLESPIPIPIPSPVACYYYFLYLLFDRSY